MPDVPPDPAAPGAPAVSPGPLRLLPEAVLDRATAVLLLQACGDALGVPYEFAEPPAGAPQMRGGGLGPYAPGEWSDDTQMSVCVARVSARGGGLRDEAELDDVAAAFEAWRTGGATDVGTQTAAVLAGAARRTGGAARRLREAATELHAATGRTAGNGALMRTGVVGLVALDDRRATARAARAVAELTHPDPLAGDSCVLWSEAVRVAVVDERLDVRAGLDLLPKERRAAWEGWIADAERPRPAADLRANGYTVTALQAAWHAVVTTLPPAGVHPVRAAWGHARDALTAAVRIGGDTDTVAAIAGALLGARHGTIAAASDWRWAVHGWPGMGGRRLGALARVTAQGGPARPEGPAPHGCALCGTVVPDGGRHPGRVCRWCVGFGTDEAGRPVHLRASGPDGRLAAGYADGSPAPAAVAAGTVWVDGTPLAAHVAGVGDLVVRLPEGARPAAVLP